ncbi:G-type lectin S-receptor-like serine/threonine-protein kinase At1g61500 isoform X2 [Ziziphus jujuba]|uniref:Receptor-like serine/threonine-protein kinase n=1 Tax=Ziziphus jujuba TaxID=326968 RepID=A0A6P4A0Y5_ZIZJJ|nr:G-type lectin S-receptor-like serine/threonine-protein kinase At1g61500 isoform X2 [Ziziphus jujuba]
MGAKHTFCIVFQFSVCLLFYLFQMNRCYAIYNITSSQVLSEEQTLISPNQTFELGFFSPNNSGNRYVGIWYKQISPRIVVWVANRENPLAVTDSSASLTIGSNGNLNLVDGKKKSFWTTDILVPSNSSVAMLLDNGNFILKKDHISEEILWQSFDHPGDTLLPKVKLGFNTKTGETSVLTSWKSETDPSLGNFIVGIAPQTPPEAFIWINGSTPHWRSGPWDKSKFVGIPEMGSSYLSTFKLEEDIEKGTTSYYFNSFNSSINLNMFISSEGVLKIVNLMKYNESYARWNSWEAPNSSCDAYGVCGHFAVCKTSESPICNCLKGFKPKSREEWSEGNWTGGCLRKTELLCKKNISSSASSGGKEDGFWKKSMVKLPDFYEYVQVDYADECHAWCQSNCSCLAYAFVNSIGCLVWSKDLIDIQEFSFDGEDLFLRLAYSELVGRKQMEKVIISLTVIGSSFILGAIFFFWYRWKTDQKRNIMDTREHIDLIDMSDISRDTLESAEPYDPSEHAFFDFDDILVATNDFSMSNKLGQGGFGPVYKGKLHGGKEIAVKRLSSNSGQGAKEFKNEMILISKLQHRNLVRLIGCCIYKEEKLLIYEFMPNKSLDMFLFDSRRRSELNWSKRFNIILGVAKGLLYLHHDSYLRVIHRDLKASNILLDENLNPKISDFGLARIFQGTLDLANTHRVVGTLGYMSPEYAMGGILSEKSDVYSFGVLLLEIVSGKKNNNFHYHDQLLSLIAYAWHLWSECRALDLMDEILADSYSSPEVVRCIDVGLLCAQDHPMDRPTMQEVVFMLSNETDRPKPKEPLFYFQSALKYNLKPQTDVKSSINEATMSMIEGR